MLNWFNLNTRSLNTKVIFKYYDKITKMNYVHIKFRFHDGILDLYLNGDARTMQLSLHRHLLGSIGCRVQESLTLDSPRPRNVYTILLSTPLPMLNGPIQNAAQIKIQATPPCLALPRRWFRTFDAPLFVKGITIRINVNFKYLNMRRDRGPRTGIGWTVVEF